MGSRRRCLHGRRCRSSCIGSRLPRTARCLRTPCRRCMLSARYGVSLRTAFSGLVPSCLVLVPRLFSWAGLSWRTTLRIPAPSFPVPCWRPLPGPLSLWPLEPAEGSEVPAGTCPLVAFSWPSCFGSAFLSCFAGFSCFPGLGDFSCFSCFSCFFTLSSSASMASTSSAFFMPEVPFSPRTLASSFNCTSANDSYFSFIYPS